MTPAALVQRLNRVNAALLVARSGREQPRLDDKVIAAWNGMAIAGFARAAGALRDDSLLDAAEAAAGFLKARMLRPDGTLLRSWRNAVPGPEGQLEDYAFVIEGLLRLASTMADFGHRAMRTKPPHADSRQPPAICSVTCGPAAGSIPAATAGSLCACGLNA